METITIDFTGAKNWDEVHERISKPLDFPEWYGKNLDALWDLLTGYIAPCNIIIKGTKKVSSEYLEYVQRICNVFIEAEDEYKEIKIISTE